MCYVCVFDDDGTVPAHYHLPPSCAERSDSVGLMEVDLEMVGVESMSLIVIHAQILY